jgi:hypothetical protein
LPPLQRLDLVRQGLQLAWGAHRARVQPALAVGRLGLQRADLVLHPPLGAVELVGLRPKAGELLVEMSHHRLAVAQSRALGQPLPAVPQPVGGQVGRLDLEQRFLGRISHAAPGLGVVRRRAASSAE